MERHLIADSMSNINRVSRLEQLAMNFFLQRLLIF